MNRQQASMSELACFHPFVLDLKNRELRKDGRPIKIQPQPFKVLSLLIRRHGHIVSRMEIQQQLWCNDTFVDFEQGINFCIKHVRTALGDDATEPRYLQTLPRRGYRFIAPVRWIGDGEAPDAMPLPSGGKSTRIAVIPIRCICPGDQFCHIAEGLTEEIFSALTRIRCLRLIAPSSVLRYKNAWASAAEIGRDLGVRILFEGSIRTDGKRLLFNAHLIDTGAQETIWSRRYELELHDIFSTEKDLAQRVAEEIETDTFAPSPIRRPKHRAVDRDAHTFYGYGHFFCNKKTGPEIDKGLKYFAKAIEKDPDFAPAHAGLAEALVLSTLLGCSAPGSTLPRAKDAAIRALEIDDRLSDAHVSYALIRMYGQWDLKGAEEALERAIELNPVHVPAHLWYSLCMSVQRRLADEIDHIERSLDLLPSSPAVNEAYGAALKDQGRYDRAIEHLEQTIEMEPSRPVPYALLAGVYAETAMYDQWMEAYVRSLMLWGSVELAELCSKVYQEGGYKSAMERLADTLVSQAAQGYRSFAEIGGLYAEAGKKENAIHWLEKAYRASDPLLIFVGSRSISPSLPWKTTWYSLRSDPRFIALVDKLGLAQSLQEGSA